ncbi:MAG: Ribose-5-phosphate isomerase B [Wendovervirus sonii]|uniref:Ribose-5-phosphate isomerase B n=1 Tax=phage Lak_Megaphage_Sonny TaxID=3109229 RepID=A0ABZ0Z3S5_9CAUD|nr:MAG: Ribose-5-phosphate isomerase B [phage Lak_Megaphage_Sonny]
MDIKNTFIGFASDHAGYELKEKLKKYASDQGATVCDFGTYSKESCDYPDYAHALGAFMVVDKNRNPEKNIYGVAICGTGNGISMTINKHNDIRCTLCWNPEIAKLARQHNDANVLSMPARFISDEEAFAIFNTFFSTDFEGGRHQRRVEKINKD